MVHGGVLRAGWPTKRASAVVTAPVVALMFSATSRMRASISDSPEKTSQLLADAAGDFQLEAVGAPLFGQDRCGRFEVAVALPVLGGLVERGAHGEVAVHQQPFGAEFEHVAAFRRLRRHCQLVEVGRGAEGIAPAEVVMRVLGRVEGQCGANAVFTEAQFGRGGAAVLRVHQIAAQAERRLPARYELDRVLGIDGVGIGLEAGRRAVVFSSM
jgi:hypothetical protein